MGFMERLLPERGKHAARHPRRSWRSHGGPGRRRRARGAKRGGKERVKKGGFPNGGGGFIQGLLLVRFLPKTTATCKTYTPLTADNHPFSRVSATTMSGTSMRHFWAKNHTTKPAGMSHD